MPLDGHSYVQSSAGRRRVTRVRRRLALDYETFSEAKLTGEKSVGVWNYSTDTSTEALMVAYRPWGQDWRHVDLTCEAFPAELEDALLDEDTEKWAFNAAFERLISRNVLGIETPYKGWRCTMALANMQSFTGDLLQVGTAMGLPEENLKDNGHKLIKLFCEPQRITKANPLLRRTRETDPFEWQMFCEYNIQDVLAEESIYDKLIRFEIPEDEWEMYEIDQEINDTGLPVNREFVQNAEAMSELRKAELKAEMIEVTGLVNPNSTQQLLPWLQLRGYPFADLQKATVTKVLREHEAFPLLGVVEPEAARALKLRQNASRTSVKKYPAILRRLSPEDDNLRHAFQFGGAARTLRWSGRGPQPHNLTRTPKELEGEDGDWWKLEETARIIEAGDYDALGMFISEPMTALAGSVRSSFQAHEGTTLTVCDLKAIESAVIAWLSGCTRMLDVFAEGRDPYKDFGVELYKKVYAEITGGERTICKPAVLGCGFQLGGGTLKEGKRTGLWGYAENMGVDITEEEANRQVKLFRKTYPEIPTFWYDLDRAAKSAINGTPVIVNGFVRYAMDGPYLTAELPSGRKMYYYKPRITTKEFEGRDRETGRPITFTRRVISYMGKNQYTHQWGRVYTSGGKQCLGAHTRVLTNHGWKPIVEVTSDDRLWDGAAWVEHDGVVCNGVKPVIKVDGIRMTADHRLLTTSGWKEGEDCDGFDRYPVSLPDGTSFRGVETGRQSETYLLGNPLRVWSSVRDGRDRVQEIPTEVLRLQKGRTDRFGGNDTWSFSSSRIPRLALDVGPVSLADASGVGELRRARNNGLPGLGTVREFLGRYGFDLSARTDFGTNGQQRRVFVGKLRVGDDEGTGEQSEVFDIVNAGPNHCFVIAGENGPIISHNCENVVQATARDILKIGLRRAKDIGFRIVGSVHDEIITLTRLGDNYYTLDRLRDAMIAPVEWATGLPLGASGYQAGMYRKE